MKGFSKQNKTISSSKSSSGSSTSFNAFFSLSAYPTRDDSNTIFFTWNDYLNNTISVNSIRMYVTTTDPSTIDLSSFTWGDNNPFKDVIDTISNTDITDSALEGELYRTWVTGEYYVFVAWQYYLDGESEGRLTWAWINNKLSSNVSGSAPSISYDETTQNLTIGTSMTGRRVIEFYNSGKSYGYPTTISDEETLNEMYYVSLVDMERNNPYQGYYYLSNAKLEKWAKGNYTVGVTFKDYSNYSTISNAIDNSISEVNSVLNDYGIHFTRSGSAGDISFEIDTEFNLFGINPSTADYVYGGTWETTTNSDGEIISADIKIATDFYQYIPYTTYPTLILEEFSQSMGAGYDQTEYPFDTLHTDFNYHNKPDYLTTKDKNILNLVYSDYVSPNDDYTTVAKALNIPKGCYIPTDSTADTSLTVSVSDFLTIGNDYNVRVFVVNSSGEVSYTSSWVSISLPPVSNWSWTSSNGNATALQTSTFLNTLLNNGDVSTCSYLVWNDLVDKVMQTLNSINKSWNNIYTTIENTKMTSSDKTLTATRFNSLRYNIGSNYSTGIDEVSSGDTVYAWYFTTLANVINEWIATLS